MVLDELTLQMLGASEDVAYDIDRNAHGMAEAGCDVEDKVIRAAGRRRERLFCAVSLGRRFSPLPSRQAGEDEQGASRRPGKRQRRRC